MLNETIHFTVDARLVAQLGEQLVPSDVTALAELIKNAYDADATVVIVDYRPDEDPPRMIIEDDGHGMTTEDIRNGWLNIGTAMKESMPSTPLFKRVRTGRKGIGRFASQRLGKQLTLWSTTKASDTALIIDFDWDKFKSGKALDEIHHILRQESVSKHQHGTRLTIKRLQREWSEADLKEVLEDLIRLQAPPDKKSIRDGGELNDPGFSVLVSVNGSHLQKDLDELDLLRDERSWSVFGSVDKNSRGRYEFSFYKPKAKLITEPYPKTMKTGPLNFRLDVFTYGKEFLEKLSIREAADLGKRYGGCRIWRDGFRVFPYGEKDDDWVGLDAHVAVRRPPLNLPRNVQILGGVRISAKSNPELIDLLTRRGLVDNQAFRDLKSFILEGLKVGANEHAALSAKKSRGGPARSKPSEATIREIQKVRADREAKRQAKISIVRKFSDKGSLSDKEILKLEKSFEEEERAHRLFEENLINVVAETEKDLIDENSMLRILASLGTGLAAFSHEFRMVGSSIGIAAQEIEALIKSYPSGLSKEIKSSLENLRAGIGDLATYRKYIDDFIQIGSRRKRQIIELEPYIKSLLNTFSRFLKARSVLPLCDIQRGLFTAPIHRAELNSIVFNLLTNAVKAVLALKGVDRKILFKGYQDGTEVCLVVADTGCGIPKNIADRIFEPFVTREHVSDDEALGQGTGLGLSIVQSIISAYGGTVEVVTPPHGYNTALEVRIPAKE